MLTAEQEGAQVKAHNYWSAGSYGPLRLDSVSESRACIEPSRRETRSPTSEDQPYVIVRKFTLRHENDDEPREVTQLQYSSWPDFGAPAHPRHLLGLVEVTGRIVDSDKDVRESKRPIMVHCSAGCGRTGTFCTVDSVIDVLKRQRGDADHHMEEDEEVPASDVDLVEKAVEDFRQQRLSMVQSLRQFVLCYESVMEWLVDREKGMVR